MEQRKKYEERLGGALDDKLRILNYIPEGAKYVLDVGCHTGQLTMAMANRHPSAVFHGIDVDKEAIKKAHKKSIGHTYNTMFVTHYLRDMLSMSQKYDAVVFSSVLHEIYSYGQGMSSVVKALADAYELLKPGGRIILRDMPGVPNRATRQVSDAIKVDSVESHEKLLDFERVYGNIVDADSNSFGHFLLKSLYYDNWETEMKENYTAIDFIQLNNFLRNVLGMEEVTTQIYTLGYLHNNWLRRFGIQNVEEYGVRSTMLVAYEKEK